MRDYRDVLVIFACLVLLLCCGAVSLNTALDRNLFCQNNLRKIYQYNQMYEEEHGELPPVCLPQKPLWKFWSGYIRDYRRNETDFTCPDDPRGAYMFERANPLFSYRTKICVSYGMNWFLCANYAKKKGVLHPRLKNLSKPSGVVFLGDCRGPYMLPPRLWTHERAFRHEKNSANFIFADGSVKNMVLEDFGRQGDQGTFKTDFSLWYWN